MYLYGKNDQSLMESGSGDLDEVFAQNLLEGYVDTSGHTDVICMALQPCFHFTKDINHFFVGAW